MTLLVDIRRQQGDFALDVTFDAPPGITVLFGRSGSGKTSVINAVAGLVQPDQGHISVAGRVLFDGQTNLPVHKRNLGYVFQDARLFPHLTVAQNLDYGRWFRPRALRRADRDKIVEMLGIGSILARRPAALSGGEKQRVAIGRALLSDPAMILADEPLAALDNERKAEILPYFERLRDELQVPILYVSHAPAEVARLATTVVVLDQGRVVRAGPATEVLSDPQVTPLGPTEAGAVLDATVTRHHDDGLTELLAGTLPLLVPQLQRDPGTQVRVRVEAQDVMLALYKPQGISALNAFPAVVRDIRIGTGPGALVQIEAGGNLLLARITRRSVTALGLAPGQPVFAVLKAVSVARD
ncbi:molybdenum ABC transporter ATP-binding protein [uncultured Maritimibacter sp.]|uniref:molybdenum ABC transporter ATP-binding protein n=1 Tax=uncultured Maritimibacter sp. TaxID=991866 RepID=UPI000AC7E758|nr:molybdenum ABC transporter ATP-binding protein [uncultured Maritimibacter sp.]